MKRLLAVILCILLSPISHAEALTNKNRTIKILSIDGGGVRGIIPAIILKHIESRLQKKERLVDCFDVMSGTSTGGLIVLMLNILNDEGDLKYNTHDIVHFYKTLSSDIFKGTLWHSFKSFGGITGAKYDASSMEKLLSFYLGNQTIADTYTNVVIPAFDIIEEKMYFFRNKHAQKKPHRNYYLRDIARATSAAPTYFEPARVSNYLKNHKNVFIDGGIGVNNPTISAIIYGLELFGKEASYFVLSLGCGTTAGSLKSQEDMEKFASEDLGKLDWATKILDILMFSVSDVTHYQAMNGLSAKHYYRIQLNIDQKYCHMDDATTENIKALEQYAVQYIADNEKLLAKIVEFLDNN